MQLPIPRLGTTTDPITPPIIIGGGGYSITLKPAQFEQFKDAGYFAGFTVNAEKNPGKHCAHE